MIGIPVRKVRDIIELGHELEAAEDEFIGYIESLTEEEQASLVALMWVGRGAFEAGDWDDALNTALTEATTPTADYLKGAPHFADHLESGLEEMGLSEVEDDDEEGEDPLYEEEDDD